MLRVQTKLRGTDSYGSGRYGASRGTRKHTGIDYAVLEGSTLLSPIAGRVSKLGYPYGDDLSFRYVQITTEDNFAWRFFYIEPAVRVPLFVKVGDVLGSVQDLDGRYPGITPHIHLEIKNSEGTFENPKNHLGLAF